MDNDPINDILAKIYHTAKKNGYKSYDVSDLMKHPIVGLARKMPDLVGKGLLYPFNYLRKYHPEILRKTIRNKGYIYPQGLALMIRGMIALAQTNNPGFDRGETIKMARWLIKNKSPGYEYFGWGQPFLWYSRKPFPPNTPRATVSSQVALAFLDMYEFFGNIEYLDIASSVCELFINHFNYTPDENGNFCLSYTTLDNYHIHNASMLAACVLFKVGSIKKENKYLDFGQKLADFTASYQNIDGSFYYWAPPDKLNYMIDNYHTGFVLESYKEIIDCGKQEYRKTYESGMQYYYEYLFDGPFPKHSNKNKYPIDIQSAAQSIITFALDGRKKYIQKSEEIYEYILDKMYLKDKNHFGYRIYKNGYFDTSYYFRWGDAWMFKAMAYILRNKMDQ